MDPNMMKMAAEQFQQMSPEQRANMMKMVQGMDPSFLQNSMASMGMPAVDAEQLRSAQQQMGSMDPSMLNGATVNQMQQQQQYMLNGAKKLKEEGNALHRLGEHDKAIAKYSQVVENLKLSIDAESIALVKACTLNIAACHLKCERFTDVVEVCSKVLASDKSSLKAYYRRGLAKEQMGELEEAVEDLKQCRRLQPNDVNVKQALERCADAAGITVEDEPLESTATSSHTTAASSSSGSNSSTSTAPASGSSSVDRAKAMAAQAADVYENNPEMLREQHRSMLQKSDQELAPMAAAAGVSVEEFKFKARMVADASDEQLADMAKNLRSGANITPEMAAKLDDPALRANMANPEAVKLATQRLSDPVEAARLSEAYKRQTGMDVNPDQIKAMTKMMESMPPETMSKMMEASMKMQQSMQAGGATTPGAAKKSPMEMAQDPAMMEQAKEMMRNPEMVKAMGDMMSNMDADTLDMMSKQTGMKISPEMAQKMGTQLKEMKPETMEALVTWAGRLQAVFLYLLAIWKRMFGTWIRAAISIVFLAILLGHYLGYT